MSEIIDKERFEEWFENPFFGLSMDQAAALSAMSDDALFHYTAVQAWNAALSGQARPIESAPRDGTWILVDTKGYDPEYRTYPNWYPYSWLELEEIPGSRSAYSGWICADGCPFEPSKNSVWLPMPPAPTQAKGGE